MDTYKALWTICVCSIMFAMFFVTYAIAGTEKKTIEGQIIDVDVFYNDDGSIKYMTLLFLNGTSIDIDEPYLGYGINVDFTVNSKQIINFYKRPWQEYWQLEKIIKIP